MLTEKFKDVLKHEGVVTVVSWGDTPQPHIANTWNSYIVVTEDGRLLIPAAGFRKTEKNVLVNPRVKLSLGSKEVLGYKDYQGTGFIVEGTAKFIESGVEYDEMKEKFSFLSRVFEVTPSSIKQGI